MKPKRGRLHPGLSSDSKVLLGGPDALSAGFSSGFTLIYKVWLKEGVPAELWHPQPGTVNGFQVTVIDEFSCSWLLGWQPKRAELVLFAALAMESSTPATDIIERYRARIESPE